MCSLASGGAGAVVRRPRSLGGDQFLGGDSVAQAGNERLLAGRVPLRLFVTLPI